MLLTYMETSRASSSPCAARLGALGPEWTHFLLCMGLFSLFFVQAPAVHR